MNTGIVLAAVSTAVLLTQAPGSTKSEDAVWFSEDFENPGSANRFGFGYFYGTKSPDCRRCNGAGEDGLWSMDHLPTGDADGSGAAHLVRFAGADQFTMGWGVTPEVLRHSFRLGDHYYLRLRVRLDDDFRFVSATKGCFDENGPRECAQTGQNKFLLMGSTGTPQSRVLVLLQKPTGNLGCTLGASSPNRGVRTSPDAFRLKGGDWDAGRLRGRYGSFSVHTNIGAVADGCVGPVLTTYGNNPDHPASPRGAPPVDGWHYLQIFVKSGVSGAAEYKIWDNNNDFEHPTYAASGFALGTSGWDQGFTIGGHTTGPLAAPAGYRIGQVEIGSGFKADWFRAEPRAAAPRGLDKAEER